MGVREELEKKLDRKFQEVSELEMRAREGRAYIQALLDTLKILPQEITDPETILRPGTVVAKVRDAIRKAGRPLHISLILKAIGKSDDRQNRAAVGGTLSTYVRKGQVFTRPGPNTYGLVEFEMQGAELPDSFGADTDPPAGVSEPAEIAPIRQRKITLPDEQNRVDPIQGSPFEPEETPPVAEDDDIPF